MPKNICFQLNVFVMFEEKNDTFPPLMNNLENNNYFSYLILNPSFYLTV